MARMEAGVRRRKNGDFEKRFTVGGKRYSVYAPTTKELKAKELARRSEIEKGLYKGNNSVTLDAYFVEYQERRKDTIKGQKLYNEKSAYKHISKALGKRQVKAIERREIIDLQSRLLNSGLAAATVNVIIALLHSMLSEAVRDEIIAVNPCASIRGVKDKTERKKASETIHRALTEQEQAAFMDEIRSEFYYPLFAFCFATGVRIGEAAALTWGDIDRKNKLIHITKTVTRTSEGKTTTGTPKTKASLRDIPLKDELIPVLEIARKQAAIIRGDNVIDFDKAQLVFPTPYGNFVLSVTLDGDFIPRILKRLENKGIKIDRFTMHATRDTFATRFIEQGGQPQTLKSILGHSSLAMTMDLYAHVLPNTKADEMERIKIYI